MTNSILNQDPNIRKFKKNAIYYDKTQHANFGGKSLFWAIKQQFNSEN